MIGSIAERTREASAADLLLMAQIKTIGLALLELTNTAAAQSDTEAASPFIETNDTALARSLLMERRARIRFFAEGLLGEPVWDLLLDLFIAGEERRSVSVTSACIATGLPSTTALRCLALLVDHRLVAKWPDANDARRVLVTLASGGREAVLASLSAIARSRHRATSAPQTAR